MSDLHTGRAGRSLAGSAPLAVAIVAPAVASLLGGLSLVLPPRPHASPTSHAPSTSPTSHAPPQTNPSQERVPRAITRWLVRGPIPADSGLAGLLRDDLGGEATALPSSAESAADGTWRAAAAKSDGRLDLQEAVGEAAERSAFYAHVYVRSPDERDVTLVLDSDDDLAVRLNGQRVWVNPVARGLGFGSDTVAVRLAAGWNSLLLKVVNRSGDAGLLGRLEPAAASLAGGVSDLELAVERPPGMRRHNLPAAGISVGPVRLRGRLEWRGDSLVASLEAGLAAWGPAPLHSVRLRLRQAGATLAEAELDSLPPGLGRTERLRLTARRLRGAALDEQPIEADVRWAGGGRRVRVPIDAAGLLRRVGGRLELSDLARARAARLRIPTSYAGLTLDLFPLGVGPEASYLVNGEPREWHEGKVELCTPCRAGEEIRIEILAGEDASPGTAPLARMREPGFAEYADGRRYAELLTGRVPPVPPPDAREWLRALGKGDGGVAYAALVARYRDAYAPLAAETRRDTLFLVGNSHIDAAWLWRWEETRKVIQNTWRTSLKLARIFPGYVFAASSAAYYEMLDRDAPGLADSIRAAVQAGSWVPVGGWWVEADQNLPSGESLVRQGLYGQRYFQRAFARRSPVAWTPDSFGYAWTVPQILRGSGFEAFVTQKIRWNDSTEFPFDAFLWEGNDGTRVFTYNPYGYVHDLSPDRLVEERLEDRRRTGARQQIVLYGVGDHGGGPTIEMLQRKEDAERIPTFPAMRYASPEEALRAVRAGIPADSMPTWRDELYLEYHRGTYTTQAEMKRRNRRSEAMLQTAEALAAVAAGLPGGYAYPRDRLESAWRRILFNQFHDILPGSGIAGVYEDARAAYDSAWATIDEVAGEALAHLAAQMDTRGDGRGGLVVFNPLGWPRRGTVRLATGEPGRVLRTADKEGIPVTLDEVPPLGAIVVPLDGNGVPVFTGSARSAPRVGANWLENDLLRVEIDPRTGDIVRLTDRRTGREALRPGGRANRLWVFDDRPAQWDAWNIVTWKDRHAVTRVAELSAATSAEWAEITIGRRWGDSRIRQRLRLWRDRPYLEIENEVEWHETHKLLKVSFEPAAQPDSATYEIPYGSIGRSGRPRTKAERAKFEVPGQRWADVSEGGYGFSVLNDSKYGWDYRDGVLRLTLLRSPTWPDPAADRGTHRFRFALYPHAGDARAAGTHRLAAEFNVPLIATFQPPHRGPLGRGFSLASTDRLLAAVEWAKRAEDDPSLLVLRIVERSGAPIRPRVAVACRRLSAWKANLLEDPGAELEAERGAFRLALRPYEIATALVRCEN